MSKNMKGIILTALVCQLVPLTLVARDTTIPFRLGRRDERRCAYDIRSHAARYQNLLADNYDITAETNGDETAIPHFAAQFSKSFEHDPVTGLLTPAGQAAYQQLVKALTTGNQADFNAIARAAGSVRLFVNPQAALAYSMEGRDTSLIPMPDAPLLRSKDAAADMLEVYLKALCRDVHFNDYGTGQRTDNAGGGVSLTGKAVRVLQDLNDVYEGPRNGQGNVDSSVLFRGLDHTAATGPYVSQFLLQPMLPLFPAGCAPFIARLTGVQNFNMTAMLQNQKLPIPQQREFGVSWNDYIAIQNGSIPKVYATSDYHSTERRYPITGRDLGGYVHMDGPYEPYYNALRVLASYGFPISRTSPYRRAGVITNETAGHQMGAPDAFALVGGVCLEGFKHAWAHKWRGQRRLRPEAFAGLIHRVKVTGQNPLGLHAALFASHDGVDVLALIRQKNEAQAIFGGYGPNDTSTYLLSQMYPESSPAHPAWPSGHATVAGACTTVIKAIFEDTALIKDYIAPVKVNPTDPTKLITLVGEGADVMTVGGELDKLASNVALARNFAGVHFRSDAQDGLALGEQVALRYLQDHCRTYPEQGFTGYELTLRSGQRVRITPEDIVTI